MPDLTKCNQTCCDKPAAFLFTWPGKNMAGICAAHAPKLLAVAGAIGIYVQLIPVLNETADEAKESR